MPKTTIIQQTNDPELFLLIDPERQTEVQVRSVSLTAPGGQHRGYGLATDARPDFAIMVEDEEAALYWLRASSGALTATPCRRYSYWQRLVNGWIKR
jgi:hypothetical protein